MTQTIDVRDITYRVIITFFLNYAVNMTYETNGVTFNRFTIYV